MLWSSSPTTKGAPPYDTSSTSRSWARLRSWYSSTSTCGNRRRYASATRGSLESIALGVVRGLRPLMEPPQRDQLLLQALEHLKCRRHQVVGPLIPDQRRVAELPHELPREDPPGRAADDPESGGHPHAPAVGAQPAQ